jgi:hypothetical protein
MPLLGKHLEEAQKIRTNYSYLLLALVLAVFAVAPLAYPGYMQVHTGFIPIYNLADLAGNLPHPGWPLTGTTNFDPLRGDGLLAYYAALPIVWLGKSPLDGVKAIFVLGFLLGASGVYVWLQRPLGPAGATLAALVYTYLPYHLAAVYVRGAWAEALFLGLLPWGLAAATSRLAETAAPSVYLLVGLVWALLGMSQAGLAIWGFLLLVAWLLLISRPTRAYRLALAALAGLAGALTLTFSITGLRLTDSPVDFFDHFLFPAQLFSATWAFGASRPGWNDGLALGFGFASLGLAMLSLFLAAGARATDSGPSNLHQSVSPLRISLLVLALALLLLPPARFLWQVTGLYQTLTAPWQLLGLAGLCLAAMAGASVKLDSRLSVLPAYVGLVSLTLLASYPYLEPKFTQATPVRPLAEWDNQHLMLIDYEFSVEIPPAAAGLNEPTPGRLPLADYGSLQPGDTLHVSLTWQATRPFNRDLKLFLHLLDVSGQLISQVDPLAGTGSGPGGADYFSSQWDPGRLILEDVAIQIPPDAPSGPYRLAFGLYDGDTLERLPVAGHEDGQVEIEVRDRHTEGLSLSLADNGGGPRP